MLRKYIFVLAWAWMIIVGGLLIFLPHGPVVCIVCGGVGTVSIGVISAVLGILGFTLGSAGAIRG